MDFFFLIYCNGVHAKGEGEGWGMCSGQEHDDMARATASLMEERDDQKGRAGAEWKREEGDSCGICLPP